MQNIKAIIFDFDGTFYPLNHFSRKLILSNLKDILIMGDERKSRKELRGIDFKTKERFYDEFSSKISSYGHIKKDEVYNWYYNIYQDKMINLLKKKYKLRPEIEDLFDFLIKNNIKYAILSDYPRVKEKLSALNFKSEYIEKASLIVSSDEFGGLKPLKTPFIECLKVLKVESKNCVIVGDKFSTDIQGAINSNIPYIQIIEKKDKNAKEYQLTFNEFCKEIKDN